MSNSKDLDLLFLCSVFMSNSKDLDLLFLCSVFMSIKSVVLYHVDLFFISIPGIPILSPKNAMIFFTSCSNLLHQKPDIGF